MIGNKNQLHCISTVNGKIIEQVMIFKYLGVEIISDGNLGQYD